MVFLSLRCLDLLEAYADLGQIAKLSPGVLVGYAELGLSDPLPIFCLGLQVIFSQFKVFRTVLCLYDESSANVHLGYGGFIDIASVS